VEKRNPRRCSAGNNDNDLASLSLIPSKQRLIVSRQFPPPFGSFSISSTQKRCGQDKYNQSTMHVITTTRHERLTTSSGEDGIGSSATPENLL
jgi:hypothetical protein